MVAVGRIKIEMSDERGIFYVSFDIFQLTFVDHANGSLAIDVSYS